MELGEAKEKDITVAIVKKIVRTMEGRCFKGKDNGLVGKKKQRLKMAPRKRGRWFGSKPWESINAEMLLEVNEFCTRHIKDVERGFFDGVK
ncbi:hypothetical protein M0804_014677 [Polistes exclamans]|nr:hypothetical protein M0804_014678 [Polistes exclamans]KAI4474780.1 hypothetical protein M0804_014677 [Polistes exclamans]